MDNENGKLLVQAGKSALNITLKQPAKPSYSRKAYCLRAHIPPACLPRKLLIKKRASIRFQTALSGL